MAQKFFKNILKCGVVWASLPFIAYLSGCNNMEKTSENEVIVELTISQTYIDGYHVDASDRSITMSQAKAMITAGVFRGEIVYLVFPNNSEIAALCPNDTMICQIKRGILEGHLKNVRDPAKAYSHLSSVDLVILSIKKAGRR
jgi:uncharacterized protein YkvS